MALSGDVNVTVINRFLHAIIESRLLAPLPKGGRLIMLEKSRCDGKDNSHVSAIFASFVTVVILGGTL